MISGNLIYCTSNAGPVRVKLIYDIDRAFTEWPFPGVRQMCRYLVSLGYSAGRKRVRRRMR